MQVVRYPRRDLLELQETLRDVCICPLSDNPGQDYAVVHDSVRALPDGLKGYVAQDSRYRQQAQKDGQADLRLQGHCYSFAERRDEASATLGGS